MSRFPGIPSQNSDLTLSSSFRKIVEADHEDREAIGHTSSTMKVPRAWESCLFAWLTSLCRDCRPISARYGNAVWIHCRPPSMAKSPIVVNGTKTSLTASSLDDHTHWSDCCLSWKSARRSLHSVHSLLALKWLYCRLLLYHLLLMLAEFISPGTLKYLVIIYVI